MQTYFPTAHLCFLFFSFFFCRVVQVLWLHSSWQHRQKPEQEDGENTREQSRNCNVTKDVFFRAYCWDLFITIKLSPLWFIDALDTSWNIPFDFKLFHLCISNGKQITTESHLSDACWKRFRRFRGEPTCWSASTSLTQLSKELVIFKLGAH